MNLKRLILLTEQTLVALKGPPPDPKKTHIDLRTVRYYDLNKNLDKGTIVGRESQYESRHFKQLVLIKHMQSRGYSLKQIEGMKSDLDDRLEAEGFDVRALDHSFEDHEAKKNPSEDEEDLSMRKQGRRMDMTTKRKSTTRALQDAGRVLRGDEETLVVVPNGPEYATFREFIKLGSTFVFADGLTGEHAEKLHVALNGARAGAGSVKRAIIPVETSLPLPGCTISAKRQVGKDAISLILPDKDVYKEGDDTARLFVFDPSSRLTTQVVSITLNGVQLDRLKVELDRNGCGLARFATLVSGNYEASIDGRPAKCSFQGARYELVPFTVSVTGVTGKGDKIQVDLRAETFGSPYSGSANAGCVDDQGHSSHLKISFSEGSASVKLDLTGFTGAIALHLADSEDLSLVASTPIRGLRKDERDNTPFSQMGSVVSATLIPGSLAERGISLSEDSRTNSPISLSSVIGGSVKMLVHEAAEGVVVLVRNPIAGTSKVHEVGLSEKGQVIDLSFDGPVAFVSVGAFVAGKPWEGHGTVLKAVAGTVSVEAPTSIEPGEELTFKVSAPAGSSVLVKISDKRLMAKDEPFHYVAAGIKRWVSAALGNRKSGFTGADAPMVIHHSVMSNGILRGFSNPSIEAFGTYDFGSHEYYIESALRPQYMVNSSSNERMLMSSSRNEATLSASSFADAKERVLKSRFDEVYNAAVSSAPQRISGFNGSNGISGMSGRAGKAQSVREIEADVVYCDLLEIAEGVGRVEREVTVSLPDSIGLYDIRAFGVSGDDWSEHQVDVRVEKAVYVEPLIPQFAKASDGVNARAVIVNGARAGSMISVRVDGNPVEFKQSAQGGNVHVSWLATPGIHEVSVVTDVGTDKVRRIVEEPGEEIVLTQEMVILKNGKRFDLVDSDAISVQVLPSIGAELKMAVYVCTDFSHSCCEQTSAKVVSAMVAYLYGEDSDKDKAKQAIVNGEARMRSMFHSGGFNYYPGGSVNAWASQTAAQRLLSLKGVAGRLDQDVKSAVSGMVDMAEAVAKVHGEAAVAAIGGKAEVLYHQGKTVPEALIAETMGHLKGGYYYGKAEICYCAAALLKSGDIDKGIDLANFAAKQMGSANGGGMHGTCECLAYLHMVNELRAAGIVAGAKGSIVKVDDKKMSVAEASKLAGITSIEAMSTIAIRVNSIKRIRFEEVKTSLPMSLSLTATGGGPVKAGKPAILKVILTDGYNQGDVLCVRLPDGLSQVVGGAKAKKVQVDFAGKNEVQVDLVAHEATSKPQHWAAVVRNMYDEARVGSVGDMTVSVEA